MLTKILASETPASNTGVNATNECHLKCRVDWIQGTFNSKYFIFVKSIVESYVGGGEFKKREIGLANFERAYEHPIGVLIGCGLRLPGLPVDNNYCYLELSGGLLGKFTQRRTRKLIRVLLRKVSFNFTRLDCAIDDYLKRFDLRTIKEAADKHWYTGFGDTCDYRERGRKGSKGGYCNFGNKGKSGGKKQLSFYPKDKESKGKIDAFRTEIRLYRDFAQQAAEHLAMVSVDDWGEIIRGYILGAIDFRKRKDENDKNPKRAPRLRWWKWFATEDALVIVPDGVHRVSSYESKKKFLERIAPTIACVMNAMVKAEGIEQYETWRWTNIFDGEERMNEHHWYIVNSA